MAGFPGLPMSRCTAFSTCGPFFGSGSIAPPLPQPHVLSHTSEIVDDSTLLAMPFPSRTLLFVLLAYYTWVLFLCYLGYSTLVLQRYHGILNNAKKKLETQSVCAGKAAANRLKGASSLMDRITPDRQTASRGCLGSLLVQERLARREPFILPGCA